MRSLARTAYDKLRAIRALRINKLDFHGTYPRLVRSLKLRQGTDRAMQLAVGGEFEAFGVLELEILKHFGLHENDYVIDIGCGSGRLAKPLSAYLKGAYLGIDIVPELVRYAQRIVARPDWRFEVAEGLRIPERDGSADLVCFFSVFTHLLHEQTYVYLEEARRALKPGGRIVFSFLDFTVPSHWRIFEANIADLRINAHPLNMFMSCDAIAVWAERLGMRIVALQPGEQPFIPLARPVAFESGAVMEQLGTIGQSVCVLEKAGKTG